MSSLKHFCMAGQGDGSDQALPPPAATPPPLPGAAAQPPAVARTGYQGFGSFHSDNVEEMASDPGWQPLPNPCEAAAGELPAPGELGAAARRHFLIDFAAWTFLNHGAFGGVLRCAQQEAEAWRRRCEAQPLLFLDRELFAQLVRVMRELATFVGCRPQDLALVPNATTGLNTVVQSWRGRLGPGDALFSLDIGYGSVKKMLAVLAEQTGAEHVEMAVQLPLSRPEELVAQVAAALPAHAKLAVFDAVTSNTAIVLPLRELVQLCHSRGVQVLIDGAHAPGQLPLDLERLEADFFVANCHKWLCAARGSAFMHVRPEHQRHVRPLIVSHGYGSGFVSEFIWDGCRDYAPLLAISAALRAWRQLGLEAVQGYQQQLLAAATDCLVAAWGTGTLVPLAMCGAMALVELPVGCTAAAQRVEGSSTAGAAAADALRGSLEGGGPSATSADAKWVQDTLHYQHRIECPVKCVGGRLYVRISAHIYNALADYERLAAAGCSIAGLEQQSRRA